MKAVMDYDEGAVELEQDSASEKRRLQVAIRLSTVLIAAGLAALIAGVATLSVLLTSAHSDIHDRDARAANDEHAKRVAMDYAVGASTIDYRDTKSWYQKLKADTTPQLATKFDATAPQLDQILLPLQWTSNATPIAAVVSSESGGIYKVNAFLNVTSTSAQNPKGGQETVTYSVTLDKNSDWKITEVGGLVGALAGK